MGVKVGRFEDLLAMGDAVTFGNGNGGKRGTLLPSDLMKLPKGSWREGTEGRDRRSEKDRGQKSRGRGSEGKGQGSVVRGQEKKQRYAARVVGGTPRDQWSDVRGQQGKQRSG